MDKDKDQFNKLKRYCLIELLKEEIVFKTDMSR